MFGQKFGSSANEGPAMPNEAQVTQWRTRANTLISESSRTREALAGELPQFQRFAAGYLQAVQHYALTNARGEEREMLLELGRRAGQRSLRFSQRNEVADSQMRAEERLHLINRQIFWCQIAIALGKIAEAGLGIATWFTKVKEVLDGMKLAVDTAKAAQPIAAEIFEAATVGSSSATPGKALDAAGQVIAIVLRMDDFFKSTGTTVWNLLATIRRARNMNDAWTAAAGIAQILKTALELLKTGIERFEQSNRSGMAPAAGALATGFGVLRDLIEAGRAFAAAYEAHLEMQVALDRMERQIVQGSRFIGSEKEALANLPRLGELSQENIDNFVTSATDFNAARVMANAAREEAQRIQSEIAAAERLHREQTGRLRSATQRSKPLLEAAEEYVVRIGLLIADMAFFADPPGLNRQESGAAAAKELKDRLTKQRDLLRRTCEEFQLAPAAR
ncbi:MAG: hypothetical protein ACT4SY_01420 [Hyphomicrobiales bacterium]